MQPTIIAIVGASGSGKTYLSKLLQNELNVFLIVSYTTRPAREGEIEGLDHYYITNAHRFCRSQMLSYTRFAEYEYFALEEQVPPQRPCAYVVDERGLKYLKEEKDHKFNIISIRVESTMDTLLKRGIPLCRIKRDEDRELLPLSYYDYVVENNGSLEEFEDKIRQTYKKIQQWQNQK
ncbi:MAG: guanylate kinase [Bacteroides sp.]